jgi:putative flippase GtrA
MIRGLGLHPTNDLPRLASRVHTRLPRIVRTPSVQRILRFGTSGAISAVFQLAILSVLLDVDIRTAAANFLAFLAGAQLNFLLNRRFTWRDRETATSALATWARFMCAVSITALLNLGVFALADLVIPSLIAAAIGIAVVAVANFVIGDRAVFVAAASHLPAVEPLERSIVENQEIEP